MLNGLYEANEIRNSDFDTAKEMVRHNLTNSDRWLIRGLLAIFEKQTADEKASEATRYDNEVGFNGLDAKILSSFAKQVQEWKGQLPGRRRFASPLSPKQVPLARRKMMKYSGQLVRIAQKNIEAQPAVAAG